MNPAIYYLSSLSTTSSLFCAYSLRRVVSGYTGFGIQVRRGTTANLQNFSFDAITGELDYNAIKSFVGIGNVGYVRSWYDQSGNGNTLGLPTGVVAGREPRIVDASGNIYTENGKPAVTFVGGFSNLETQNFSTSKAENNLSIISVYTNNDATFTVNNCFKLGETFFPRPENGGDYFYYGTNGYILFLGLSSLSTVVYSSLTTPTQAKAWKNNVLVPSAPISVTSSLQATRLRLGYNEIGNVFRNFNGAFQEILIYTGNPSNRYSLTSEMMSYYNIT
jgi:hypothetical protein